MVVDSRPKQNMLVRNPHEYYCDPIPLFTNASVCIRYKSKPAPVWGKSGKTKACICGHCDEQGTASIGTTEFKTEIVCNRKTVCLSLNPFNGYLKINVFITRVLS